MDSRRLERALSECYDAVIESAKWEGALELLGAELGAMGGVLVPKNPELIGLGFPSARILHDVMDAYLDGNWHLNDVRADRGWKILESKNSIVVEHQITTDKERSTLPYYQELFNSFGIPWWCGIGFRVDGAPWCLTLLRGEGQGPWLPSDIAGFEQVVPHLVRMVTLSKRLRSAATGRALSFVDLLGSPALTLTRTGCVCQISESAESLLSKTLSIRSRRIEVSDWQQRRAVQSAIERVTAGRFASPVFIHRDGGEPLIMEFIALPRICLDVFTEEVAIVIFHDGFVAKIKCEEGLIGTFSLTRSEARIAVLLAGGEELRSIAKTLNISYETVRVYLKKIFLKTGTSRQSELVAMLSRLWTLC